MEVEKRDCLCASSRDDPLIPLNFAILLYTMDENRGAAEQ
jgi:hypothetical protein